MVSMTEEPDTAPDGPVDTEPRPLRRPAHRNALPSPRPSAPAQLGPPSAVLDESAVSSRQAVPDIVLSPRRIFVTVEVPGASGETVGVETTGQVLTLTAGDARGFLYHREIALPEPVGPEPARVACRNGVIDVVLRRANPPGPVPKETEHDD